MPDAQQMPSQEQARQLMTNAITNLKTSVQPVEPVFTDDQASILLAYYLDRDHPPPASRECGGATEVQHGGYHFVVVNSFWSLTATQLLTGINGFRKGCTSVPTNWFWVFDVGRGMNLLDDLSQSAPAPFPRGESTVKPSLCSGFTDSA